MNALVTTTDQEYPLQSLDQVPTFLDGVDRKGLENLGKNDFKVPRIKLIQPLNPEVEQYGAIPGHFWHSGLNISLGTSFIFVPVIVNKRVVLWNPRSNGGGILAFSKDGTNWLSGKNTEHLVKLKDIGVVKWDTKGNVDESKLLDWGSSNTKNPNSPPAATLVYEYLCYLPTSPNLSPILMGLQRTALPVAKNFNTSLYMLKKPTYAVAVKCGTTMETKGSDSWHQHSFKLAGWVKEEDYKVAEKMSDSFAEYNAEYIDEENIHEQSGNSPVGKDEIPF